jgi:hypothetical protein
MKKAMDHAAAMAATDNELIKTYLANGRNPDGTVAENAGATASGRVGAGGAGGAGGSGGAGGAGGAGGSGGAGGGKGGASGSGTADIIINYYNGTSGNTAVEQKGSGGNNNNGASKSTGKESDASKPGTNADSKPSNKEPEIVGHSQGSSTGSTVVRK